MHPGGPSGRGTVIVLACGGVALLGWALAAGALVGLGVLLPGTTYSYNFQADALTSELVAGAGLVAAGFLVLAVGRRGTDAAVLAGALLALTGIVLANEACSVPEASCDPGFSVGGFASLAVGAALVAWAALRYRAARRRRSVPAAVRPWLREWG